ncbi:MAG: DUF3095 domain-containing protein [Gemmobacter sp.]
MTGTDDFLASLPVFQEFADVADASRYAPLPEGWALAVADVVASGQAIAAGRYKAVNMAAAAVITAVSNALGGLDNPYVFGGDGAAIAVPPEGIPAARAALAAVATWIAEEMDLTMRVALVPIADIRAAGLDVRLARLRAGAEVAFSMFAGGGSAWAEAEMKAGRFIVPPAPPGTRPDLSGLSCRWNPVAAQHGAIVSLIVAPGAAGATPEFRALVAEVAAIANAGAGTGRPLPDTGPVPVPHFGGVEAEVRAVAPPGQRLAARLKIILAVLMTVILHRTGWRLDGFSARDYAADVAANSDFRKFDDGLKMTIDIAPAGLARIEALLVAAQAAGICRHGLHRQATALVTCIVPSIATRDHVHFIDGAEGGYAQAARQMKAQEPT